jgi:hypothetical protein
MPKCLENVYDWQLMSSSVARAKVKKKLTEKQCVLWFITWCQKITEARERTITTSPGTFWQCKRFHALDPYLSLSRFDVCAFCINQAKELCWRFLLNLLTNHATKKGGKIQRKENQNTANRFIHSWRFILVKTLIHYTVTYDFAFGKCRSVWFMMRKLRDVIATTCRMTEGILIA